MTLTSTLPRRFARAGILLAFVLTVLLNPIAAQALGNASNPNLLSFTEFTQSVSDGRADLPRGVYVPDAFALPIVQQPWENGGFVSEEEGKLTQFRMANKYGTTGLVAHNYLAGSVFFGLKQGDEVRLVYGDGTVKYFYVTEILRYQALQPNSPYSSFRNLETDEVLSVEQTFKRVFFSDGNITFQTCIEKDGKLSWGRLFVIAVPRNEYLATYPVSNQEMNLP